MACVAMRDGKPRIDKLGTFVEVFAGGLPGDDTEIANCMQSLDDAVLKENSSVTPQALSNAHGDWYEWLLAVRAWNIHVTEKTCKVALTMPNISQFDVAALYVKDLKEMVVHLRDEVRNTSQVSLITSNPDFVILRHDSIENLELPRPIGAMNQDTIRKLDGAYASFAGKCEFESIVGFLAAKYSFRPDRRLQIPHEGSLMKALYVHLQTRLWVTNPPGLTYYAVAAEVGDADREALTTVATHSITTVLSLPQKAVDAVFETKKLTDIDETFKQILA
ncbi:MAG: Cfr10I/Bse634I family restriction endonuclease [Armatimonadetes bacterium]|nr:Cfr10I/Bse634I family restriction endonuclease [Armatimonadota bacterium]